MNRSIKKEERHIKTNTPLSMTNSPPLDKQTRWLVVVLLSCLVVSGSIHSVVVDGSKKGPSAMENQSADVEMIDYYNTRSCGLADPDISQNEFINNARHGQFPWMASFQIIDNRGHGTHFCCGAFISDKWILSAAHCFTDETFQEELFTKDRFNIVAGTPEAYSRTNEQFFAKRIYIHKHFQPERPIGFDIALVELEREAKLRDTMPSEPDDGSNKPPGERTPFINAICLPMIGKEYSPGQNVRVVGWGASEYNNSRSSSNKLLYTDLKLSDPKECATLFSKKPKLGTVKQHHDIYKDILCAQYKGKRDACQGDSGSSLIEYADNKAVSVGIVSYGLGCANPVVPGVYTKTSTYLPWIMDITVHQESATTEFTVLKPITPIHDDLFEQR